MPVIEDSTSPSPPPAPAPTPAQELSWAFAEVAAVHELGEVIIRWPETGRRSRWSCGMKSSQDDTLRLFFIGAAVDDGGRAHSHELIVTPHNDNGKPTYRITERDDADPQQQQPDGTRAVFNPTGTMLAAMQGPHVGPIETPCPIEVSLRALALMRTLRDQPPVAPLPTRVAALPQ